MTRSIYCFRRAGASTDPDCPQHATTNERRATAANLTTFTTVAEAPDNFNNEVHIITLVTAPFPTATFFVAPFPRKIVFFFSARALLPLLSSGWSYRLQHSAPRSHRRMTQLVFVVLRHVVDHALNDTIVDSWSWQACARDCGSRHVGGGENDGCR